MEIHEKISSIKTFCNIEPSDIFIEGFSDQIDMIIKGLWYVILLKMRVDMKMNIYYITQLFM